MIRLLFYSCILAALVVCGAVAYDISSSVARFEAQAAADAAALAGAATLMATIGDSVEAARAAQEVARRNTITGAPAELRRDDLSFDVPEDHPRSRARPRPAVQNPAARAGGCRRGRGRGAGGDAGIPERSSAEDPAPHRVASPA